MKSTLSRVPMNASTDEFYDRETSEAGYWKDYPAVIGGRDEESESNGTWLAASSNGKIGALLNIQEKQLIENAESRGVLVSNFVTGDSPAMQYVQKLIDSKKEYNGYNLLLFDIKKEDIKTVLHTNMNQSKLSEVQELTSGIHGLSNSRICTPYKKVNFGKQKFEEIIKRYQSANQKDSLVGELLNLLKSDSRHYPDDVLYDSKKYMMPPTEIEKLSSIFVKKPENEYGTRTHTIIMIDSDNVMDFREYSMIERSDCENPKWSCKEFKITLQIE